MSKTRLTQEIGDAAGELLKAWRAHYVASCNFGNTIFAIHGIVSPAGRIIDQTMNSLAGMYLNSDFRWLGEERGYWLYEKTSSEEGGKNPSAVARRMIDCELHRHGRRVPATPEAISACRARMKGLCCSGKSRPYLRPPLRQRDAPNRAAGAGT